MLPFIDLRRGRNKIAIELDQTNFACRRTQIMWIYLVRSRSNLFGHNGEHAISHMYFHMHHLGLVFFNISFKYQTLSREKGLWIYTVSGPSDLRDSNNLMEAGDTPICILCIV